MAPSPSHAASGPADDVAVKQQSNSAWIAAKRNFSYLVSPSKAKDHPSRFRTRAFLRTLRYVGVFVFWRLVRWAKYIAVGSLVAAIGATAFGGMISGVAWIAAPPTLGASILAGTVWGVGKIGARRLHKRWERTGRDMGQAEREEKEDESPIKREGTLGQETGPGAIPW